MNESLIRLRMATADGHYAGGLVDGARILQFSSSAQALAKPVLVAKAVAVAVVPLNKQRRD